MSIGQWSLAIRHQGFKTVHCLEEFPLKWTEKLPVLEILISLLQTSRNTLSLRSAHYAHTLICSIGLDVQKDLGNYLIPMFVDCGSPYYAQQAFSRLLHRNEHSWTALLQASLGLQCVFELYQLMQQDGVHPSRFTFMPLLTACTKLQCLERGMKLHVELIIKGFEEDLFLAYALVSMYARCGFLMEAETLFYSLPYRDVILWTVLIDAYVDQQLSEKALCCLEQMQLEEIVVDTISYVCALKACCSPVALGRGQKIHTDIVKKGMDTDVQIANTVVNMYSKCESLKDAKGVFDKLQDRDIVTWTAMVVSHVEHGLSEEALKCVEEMEEGNGVHGDAIMLVAGLKACGNLGVSALKQGQKLHLAVVKRGHEATSFVGSTLIDMYAKCGHLEEAQQVFNTLPTSDAVAWNALILGHADCGYCKKALEILEEMQESSVSQDPVTYFSGLKACGHIENLQKGQQLHTQIVRTGYESLDIIGNTLAFMYAKCSSVWEARKVFDDLAVRDAVSWTSLIAGFAEGGFGKDSLLLLDQMQSTGVSADDVTLLWGLRICGNTGDSSRGFAMHAEMIKKGFNVHGSHLLVEMYASCGLLSEAQTVFDGLLLKDSMSWNALTLGYAGQGFLDQALSLFKQMELTNVVPDAATYAGILRLCDSAETVQVGLALHACIVKQGFERDDVVGKGLAEMYIKCSPLKLAHEILYKLQLVGIPSWNALIGRYIDQGLLDDALLCLNEMQHRGISPGPPAAWNGLLLAYAEQGQSEKAVDLFLQKQGRSLAPDATVLSSILKVCGWAILLESGRRIHAMCVALNLMDVNLATSCVDMYARCGSMSEAQQVFDAMLAGDIVTWDALMRGYASHGDTEYVMYLLERLQKAGHQPDEVIFLAILSLCKHVGLLEWGKHYLQCMITEYDFTPSVKHFTCTVDLLGRSGDLCMALWLLNQMPFQPNLVVWHTILGACQQEGNIELGRLAYQQALGLDKKHGSAHVFMANIYAGARLWEEVEKLENVTLE